jgi:hypothetical protein
MKRTILLIVSLLALLVATPSAQTISTIKPITASATLTTNTCAGASISSTGCIGVNLGGYSRIAVGISGTWTGTITFEISADAGTTWNALNVFPVSGTQTAVTTATANGMWSTSGNPVPGSKFRARFSTATSGSPVVTIIATF